MEFVHKSVLLHECIEALCIRPDGVYLDGTLGGAGHSLQIARRLTTGRLIGIDQDQIAPEEYTSYFRSVIAFGTIRVLEDPAEKREALRLLAGKYFPDDPEGREAEIQKTIASVTMLELAVEHMTGKEAIELVRKDGVGPEN